jgi:hypothetical protein
MWTKTTVRRAIFSLPSGDKRETFAVGSSAAHRAADHPDRRSRWGRCGPLSPCVGLVSAPDRQGPAFASHRSVKAEGSERRFERRRVPSTGCQQPGDNPAHGHVGSSSTEGTSGAADLAPLRGGTGEAALMGSARAGPARWDRRGARPACRTCWACSLARRRALQPVLPRSHDRRCPSGSGWGEALAARAFGCPHGRRHPSTADGL